MQKIVGVVNGRRILSSGIREHRLRRRISAYGKSLPNRGDMKLFFRIGFFYRGWANRATRFS